MEWSTAVKPLAVIPLLVITHNNMPGNHNCTRKMCVVLNTEVDGLLGLATSHGSTSSTFSYEVLQRSAHLDYLQWSGQKWSSH